MRLFQHKYIRFDKIEATITRAREQERQSSERKYRAEIERMNIENSEELARVKDAAEELLAVGLQEKEAELISMRKDLAEMKAELDDARDGYKMYRANALRLSLVGPRIKTQMTKMFGRTGEIYQAFMRINDDVEKYHARMLSDDTELSRKLGIRGLEESTH